MTFKLYKHPKYGHVYGEDVPTPIGRVVWPSLAEPKEGMKQDDGTQSAARYEVTLLIPKNHPKTKGIMDTLSAMADEMLALFNKGRKPKLSNEFDIFKDGDSFDMEKYPYYKNNYVIVARNAKQPDVVDKDKEKLAPTDIEGGMKARLVIAPLLTTHGISFKLKIVQLWEDDGTRFGGAGGSAKALLDILDSELEEDETDTTEEDTEVESQDEETYSDDTEEDVEETEEEDLDEDPVPHPKPGRKVIVNPDTMREKMAAKVQEKRGPGRPPGSTKAAAPGQGVIRKNVSEAPKTGRGKTLAFDNL